MRLDAKKKAQNDRSPHLIKSATLQHNIIPAISLDQKKKKLPYFEANSTSFLRVCAVTSSHSHVCSSFAISPECTKQFSLLLVSLFFCYFLLPNRAGDPTARSWIPEEQIERSNMLLSSEERKVQLNPHLKQTKSSVATGCTQQGQKRSDRWPHTSLPLSLSLFVSFPFSRQSNRYPNHCGSENHAGQRDDPVADESVMRYAVTQSVMRAVMRAVSAQPFATASPREYAWALYLCLF